MSVQVGTAGANVAAERGSRLQAAAAAGAAPTGPRQLGAYRRAAVGGLLFLVTYRVSVFVVTASPSLSASPARRLCSSLISPTCT